MPPSFPYGGMENPRLTFLTPTVIAGDRSLVSVVAHELAHSWTGNLVTNANAEHFWLNEGFTVYAERRIVEALEGADGAALHAALGRRDARRGDRAVRATRPELTQLRTHLAGVDPDEAFSQVPYEKGYFFLRALEERGRPRRRSRAGCAATSTRSASARSPPTTSSPTSSASCPACSRRSTRRAGSTARACPTTRRARARERLDAIERLAGALPDADVARRWSPTEWQLYLESVPRPAPADHLPRARRAVRAHREHELRGARRLARRSRSAPATTTSLPRVEEVLGTVGRMKYLRPLYTALASDPRTRADAVRIFERAARRLPPDRAPDDRGPAARAGVGPGLVPASGRVRRPDRGCHRIASRVSLPEPWCRTAGMRRAAMLA